MGSRQDISCTVSTVSGVESSSVMISWIGTVGTSGMGPVMNDSRVTISPTTSSGNNYTSSLQFAYLMEGDEDNYICNVMILETTESQSVEIGSLSSECTVHTHMHTHARACTHMHTHTHAACTRTHTKQKIKACSCCPYDHAYPDKLGYLYTK